MGGQPTFIVGMLVPVAVLMAAARFAGTFVATVEEAPPELRVVILASTVALGYFGTACWACYLGYITRDR